MTTLFELQPHQKAIIIGISNHCDIAYKNRLLDLGFVQGSEVSVYISSPKDNPRAYIIQNSRIALRNEQAKCIFIQKKENE